MTMSKGAKAVALLAGSTLALAACATSSGSTGSSSSSSASASTSSKTFTWAYEQEFAQYNGNTSDGNSSANHVVLNSVINGFWEFNPDGTLGPNKDYGSYTKTSDNPLTVKYSFNPKATWSDGEPIGCDDFVMAWLANSGLTGAKGFSSAGTSGYADQNKPQCKDGDKDVTITYKKSYGDWEGLYGSATILPAHIVEKQSGMTKKFIDYADTPTS